MPVFMDASSALLTVRNSVTVQPTERLRHPSIENHFAMGRMRAGAMLSYSLRSEYTDLAELQQFYSLFSSFSRSSS